MTGALIILGIVELLNSAEAVPSSPSFGMTFKKEQLVVSIAASILGVNRNSAMLPCNRLFQAFLWFSSSMKQYLSHVLHHISLSYELPFLIQY